MSDELRQEFEDYKHSGSEPSRDWEFEWWKRGKEISRLRAASGFCKDHQPTGGTRSCLVCGVIKLSQAIGQVDALVSPPNEMECTLYDVEACEDEVVKRVSEYITKLTTERDKLIAERDHLEGYNKQQHDALKALHRLNAKRNAENTKLREALDHPVLREVFGEIEDNFSEFSTSIFGRVVSWIEIRDAALDPEGK